MKNAKDYPLLEGKEFFTDNREIFVAKSTSRPDFIDVMHTHNYIEINYILSGECLHTENQTVKRAKRGNLFIINYMTPHKNSPAQNAAPYVSYNVGFTPGALDDALKNESDFIKLKSSFLLTSIFPDSANASQNVFFDDNNFYELEPLFESMLDEYVHGYDGSRDLLRAYLLQLIVKIFRKVDGKTPYNAQRKQRRYIDLAIEYINANYMQKLKIEDIAYRSFLSKSYFSQLFKDTMGLCFSEFLQKVRISKACEILESSDKIITDVAMDVGFNDMKAFYAAFHKRVGCTPKEYRARCACKTTPIR